MRIEVVTPAPPRSHNGNRVTALRWARLLGELGHDVAVTTQWSGSGVDVLVALHARRSAAAVAAFCAAHPDHPVVVALTGTDVYRDLANSPEAQETVEAASALVVLQPLAGNAVSPHLRERVHVIYQSVDPVEPVGAASAVAGDGHFEVAFLAHLRAVKDPLLPAAASRLLPADSTVRITHLGAPLDAELGEQAAAEAAANPRYRWQGDRPRSEALALLARSRVLVLASRLEGGANVVSEALATGTPVLATRIDGSVGLLGEDYPGYFPIGDAAGLARLLQRAATDPAYLAELTARVQARRELVEPARERRSWADLLAAVSSGSR